MSHVNPAIGFVRRSDTRRSYGQLRFSTRPRKSRTIRKYWWIPGSELFLVYNEQRDTLARSFPDLSHRAFIVKINRLIRF